MASKQCLPAIPSCKAFPGTPGPTRGRGAGAPSVVGGQDVRLVGWRFPGMEFGVQRVGSSPSSPKRPHPRPACFRQALRHHGASSASKSTCSLRSMLAATHHQAFSNRRLRVMPCWLARTSLEAGCVAKTCLPVSCPWFSFVATCEDAGSGIQSTSSKRRRSPGIQKAFRVAALKPNVPSGAVDKHV